jgi:hypothetical protein
MTFAQRRYRLTTHFSESIPVVKRRMTVLKGCTIYCVNKMKYDRQNILGKRKMIESSADSIAQYSVTTCLPSRKQSPSTVIPNRLRCNPCEFLVFKCVSLVQTAWLFLAKDCLYRLAHSAYVCHEISSHASVCVCVCVCIVVFICTVLLSSGLIFILFSTELKQRQHKQHQYNAECLLVMTYEQN